MFSRWPKNPAHANPDPSAPAVDAHRHAAGDTVGDDAAIPERDGGVPFLLKEITAGHTYIGIAQSSRDAVVAGANLRSALRILQRLDLQLAHHPRDGRGSRQLRRAHRDLRRRLTQAIGQMASARP